MVFPEGSWQEEGVFKLNDRNLDEDLTGLASHELAQMKLRFSILAGFPEDAIEAIVVQWEKLEPTVLLQLKYDPLEPLQFPGERAQVQTPEGVLPAREQVRGNVAGALDPATGRPYERFFWEADILISQRAFDQFRPDPNAVLPAQMMWELRDEVLRQLHIPDRPGTSRIQSGSLTQ